MSLRGQSLAPTGSDEVLERARTGDLLAFDALMLRHEPRVFSLALRFTGRRADAEDLTQDVFVLLHASLSQLTDDEHVRRWLLRAITHRCLNRIRDEKRRSALAPPEALQSDSEVTEEASRGDPIAAAKLRGLMQELSPDARLVLLLRYQQDLDTADIAGVLGMSINTVKSHLRRSLDWLRARLAGERRGT